jgi:uncharacterized membrane protein
VIRPSRWYWERLSTSYWFVPTLMTLLALVLAFGLGRLDERLTSEFVTETAWLWKGGPEGARTLLGAVATATITVASTVFSITIVALTLASNQFGPRLLRGFMRDRGNQFVLGAFLATFVYCLLVLRSVYGDAASPFVPHLSVSVAVALAIVNVGVLIYFIHHVSTSIHADEVIAAAGRDLDQAIDSLVTRPGPSGERPVRLGALPEAEGGALCATRSGYVQMLDADGLLAVLVARDAVLRSSVAPGEFVLAGGELARVWPAAALDAADELRAAFLISSRRTPVQDLGFALDELVEIAVRALSPGINDPFTASTCVDWLCDALRRLAACDLPDGWRHDEGGRVRLVQRPFTLAHAVDAAFDAIRRNAASNVSVSLRLVEGISSLARQIRDPGARAALRRQIQMIERSSRTWPEDHDRERLAESARRGLAALHAVEPVESAPDLSAVGERRSVES